MDTMVAERTADEPKVIRGIWIRRRWSKRRKRVTAAAVAVCVALAGSGWLWHRLVTADPGLEFHGAAMNVFRAEADRTGIVDIDNAVGEEARVTFEPNGTFYAYVGLHNSGSRDLRIQAIDPVGFYYWGLERAVVSLDPNDHFPEGDEPLAPFTLPAGATYHVRLHFRMADCDPAGLRDGFSARRSLPVTYRVLGVTRTVDVPLSEAAISVGTIGHCDRPMIDWP